MSDEDKLEDKIVDFEFHEWLKERTESWHYRDKNKVEDDSVKCLECNQVFEPTNSRNNVCLECKSEVLDDE